MKPELLGMGYGPGPAESLVHVQTVLVRESQIRYSIGVTEEGEELLNPGKGVAE